MKLNTIIVDDDLMARKTLERFCGYTSDLVLTHSCEDGNEALEVISNNNIDLVFLDIEMPGMLGTELLDRLPYLPQIVFTTGNKEYAYEAYEYEVTDFLKKPITQQRFLKSVDKAILNQTMLQQSVALSAEKELYVRTDGRLVRLPYDKILYFENVGDYIKVITEIGNHVIYGALKAIDEKLTYPRFLKVHRSFIVNLDKIVDIEDNSLVIDKKVIPISRAQKPTLMKSINLI